MTVFTATDPANRVVRQVEPTSGEELEHVIARSLTATTDVLPSGRELGPRGIHEFVNAQQVWVGLARAG